MPQRHTLLLLLIARCVTTGPAHRAASPLDEGNPAAVLLGDDFSWPPVGLSPSDAETPDCMVACTEHIFPVLGTLLKAGSNAERIEQACSAFNKSEECMSQQTQCPRNKFYSVLTSGIRFMCVEQRPAFEANVQCMDKVNEMVYNECEQSCNPQSLINGLAIKDVLTKGLGKTDGGIVKELIDPHMMNIVVSESCRIGQCMLQCYRNKYNMHCDGSAGSLFSEAIVRPLDSAEMAAVPLGTIFSTILPSQCRFMYDASTLRKFRIDPELDNDLKRMYANASRSLASGMTTEERMAEALKPFYAADSENPFQRAETVLDALSTSPIDQSLHSNEPISFRAFDDEELKVKIADPTVSTTTISSSGSGESGALFEDSRAEETEGSGDASYRILRGKKIKKRVVAVHNNEIPDSNVNWEDDIDDDFIDGMGSAVSDYSMRGERSSGETLEASSAQESKDGITHLTLERTLDNADLYLAQWIIPGRKYRVDITVKPEDEGEFVCLLRTYKAFAVNRLSDAEIDELLAELEQERQDRRVLVKN